MDSAYVWTNVRGYGEIRVNDFSLIKQNNRFIYNRIPALSGPSFTNVDRGACWSTPFNSPYWQRNFEFYNYQVDEESAKKSE
jgi:hypothetical protein